MASQPIKKEVEDMPVRSSVDLTQIYNYEAFALGATYEDMDTGREYEFLLYNYGDGSIPACRGQICYPVVGDASVPSPRNEVTVDLSSTTVPGAASGTQGIFEAVVMPNVVSNGSYFWGQTKGRETVPMWANITAIDRSGSLIANYLMPAALDNNNMAGDGIVIASTEALDVTVFARLDADVDGTPTLATDRVLLQIPAGQAVTATPFVVGETVTGGTSSDTAVIVEILSIGSVQYGLIVSTVTATYFHTTTETITGGTSGATASVTTKGEQVRAYTLL
jgi:hypothetical protein